MARVNVLDEQDEDEMLERAIVMSLMEVEGQELREEELFGFTDHQLGEDLKSDHNTFFFKSNALRAFEFSDNEEDGMHIEEDVDEEEMLKQAIALSLQDV